LGNIVKNLKSYAIVAAILALAAGGVAAPAFAAGGTTYYVSPTGSDSNPGTSGAPFLHIQKCASTMVAGDTCQIATGTYRETVTPVNSGTSASRITYTAAPEATVTIDGTNTVGGWAQVSGTDLTSLESGDSYLGGSPFASAVSAGTIYKTSVTLNPGLPGNQIFEDGAAQVEAQWPYPGNNPVDPILQWSQSGGAKSVSDSALNQPAGYWNGARLSASNWFDTETGTVTNSPVGSVTASGMPGCLSFANTAAGNTHYFLSGKLEELGHPGEWFYSASSHTLYQWSPDGSNPSGHTVEAKQRNVGVDLSARSYTSLLGIDLKATTLQTSSTSTGDVIDGMTARYVSTYDDLVADPNIVTSPTSCNILTAGETTSGIILAGTGNTLRNSTIDWSAGNGVVVSGSGNTVTNNVISDVDSGGSYAAGINIVGSNQIVTHNTVSNAGRSAINIDDKVTGATASGDEIGYNDLSKFDTLSTDSGAIYVCCNVNLATTTIQHNYVHDATPPAHLSPDTLDAEAGIYLDNGTYNASVYDNVGWNNFPSGTVVLNGDSTGNHVYNNTNAYGSNQGKAVTIYMGTRSSTRVENNIGDVDAASGVTESNNLPSATDPNFVNSGGGNYQLQPTSPARMAGIDDSPATDGYTDASASEGAYQYGAVPWTAGASTTSTTVAAESISGSSGVNTSSGGTGTVLGSFDGGDWASYGSVNFGDGRNAFTGSISDDPANAGQQFQIRLDAIGGAVIGTMSVASTGSFAAYLAQSVPITPTSGTHSVYLVALGSGSAVANIDSFSFSKLNDQIEAEGFSSTSGTTTSSGATGTIVGSIDGGDWLGYQSVNFGDGRSTFTAALAADPANAGQQLQIRIDSEAGPSIGTITVSSTGSFTRFSTQSAAVTFTSGVHDVYLVGLGSGSGIVNLDNFALS
jgi:hypothetical protein